MIRSLAVVVLLLPGSSAIAQPLVYAGATTTANAAERGTLDVGTFPSAGAFIGWRLSEAWSLEFHVDRGFAEGPPHGRPGPFGTDTLQDRAREGYGVFAVWTSRLISRAAVAATMGISQRRYRTDRTIGFDRALPPPGDPLARNETATTSAGGLMGGLMLPVGLGGPWSIAPEVRLGMRWSSEGIYGDGLYLELQPGVRVMWGF